MKKFIFTIALCLAASSAFAVPPRPQGGPPLSTYHYQGGWFWQPVRVISTWLNSGQGVNRTSRVTYTHNNGCLQVIVTTYAGPFVTGQTTTEICPK